MNEGWLEAPDGREVRRHHRDPVSPGRNPTIWIDHGLPIPGEPAICVTGKALQVWKAERLTTFV
jgi:hypothetical protein